MSQHRSIPDVLEAHPRAGILQAPPIIHRLPRLSSVTGCDLHVLRDDLTGFGLGGNKTRKLDYLLGDALRKGADTLVTSKATSFSRNAAAAATACGLELHVVLPGTEADHNPLSRALFDKFGTELHYTHEPEEGAEAISRDVSERLRSEGRIVYDLHPGGSDAIGALSYVQVFHEIVDHATRSGVRFSHIIHSTSSAGTQAGLVVGQCLQPYDTQIVGISARLEASAQSERIRVLAMDTAGLLGTQLDESKILVDDDFVGAGYAIPSDEGTSAAELFARSEGLLLDPVYSAKAAAALLQYASTGRLDDGAALFIHTGGNSGLFY